MELASLSYIGSDEIVAGIVKLGCGAERWTSSKHIEMSQSTWKSAFSWTCTDRVSLRIM